MGLVWKKSSSRLCAIVNGAFRKFELARPGLPQTHAQYDLLSGISLLQLSQILLLRFSAQVRKESKIRAEQNKARGRYGDSRNQVITNRCVCSYAEFKGGKPEEHLSLEHNTNTQTDRERAK